MAVVYSNHVMLDTRSRQGTCGDWGPEHNGYWLIINSRLLGWAVPGLPSSQTVEGHSVHLPSSPSSVLHLQVSINT